MWRQQNKGKDLFGKRNIKRYSQIYSFTLNFLIESMWGGSFVRKKSPSVCCFVQRQSLPAEGGEGAGVQSAGAV